jgi:hypothetical protein
MQEIQTVVNNKVAEMISGGAIQEAIEKGIEQAVNKAINEQFSTWGNITKQLEKSLKEGLQINTSDLPFESYNQQMLVAVKSKINGMFKGEAAAKFMAELDKTLAPVPKEMPINHLVDAIAAEWKTDEPWDASDLDEYASVELKEHDGALSGSYSLEMWKQKESCSSYSSRSNTADLQLYISDSKIRISHKSTYNPTCLHDEEALIFKLYAAGTIITGLENFDSDDCDLTLKETDY